MSCHLISPHFYHANTNETKFISLSMGNRYELHTKYFSSHNENDCKVGNNHINLCNFCWRNAAPYRLIFFCCCFVVGNIWAQLNDINTRNGNQQNQHHLCRQIYYWLAFTFSDFIICCIFNIITPKPIYLYINKSYIYGH